MRSSRAAVLFVAVWAGSVAVLAANGHPIEETLMVAAILGLALPALALLVCRGLPARALERPVKGEGRLLALLVAAVAFFLAAKGPLMELLVPAMADARPTEIVDLLLKLALFVALPLGVYRWRARLSLRALGLTWPPDGPRGRSIAAFVAVGAALAAIQFVLGRNARPLVDGSLAGRHAPLAFLLCFLWMSLEAGLVEELFFRIILQSRLAALARSQVSGLFLSALVFGLAHAPGLWLRGAGAMEGMSSPPSPLLAAAYCVATMGTAGLVFGALWLRTRNWLLIVLLHGLTDALSNTPRFMDVWRF